MDMFLKMRKLQLCVNVGICHINKLGGICKSNLIQIRLIVIDIGSSTGEKKEKNEDECEEVAAAASGFDYRRVVHHYCGE